MKLVKWNAENSIDNIIDNMDHILNYSSLLDNYKFDNNNKYSPLFDILDNKNQYNIYAEIPGLEKKDISINIDQEMLIIEGEKKKYSKKHDNLFRSEIDYGVFCRKFHLPKNIDKNLIKASLKNGVLKINIEKTESIKPKLKQINIV